MENDINPTFANELAPLPEKPQFLKILCILSFVSCGLWILIFGLGSSLLGLGEEAISAAWEKMVQAQPAFEGLDPVATVHAVGMFCVYNVLLNAVSLIGVILMWRLNKIGFIIYVLAEIGSKFLGVNVTGLDNQRSSYGGIIFMIFIDLIFIVMYAVNLKYMNKKADSI